MLIQRVYLETHGCQMNEYDSDRLFDGLKVAFGCEQTQDPAAADLLVLNTCSIREKAQEKVFSLLGRWRELKQERPGTLIAVGGCVASQEGEALRARAPFVDVVFGPQTLHRLPSLIRDVQRSNTPAIDVSFPEIEKFDRLPEPRLRAGSAFLSVMEGCSKYCTFCVVPYTRGEEISRPFDDVLAEAAGAVAQGAREIHLLGQNVNAYRGLMHDGTQADLALLIRYVAALEGVERVRFTTSHPVEFSDSLIEVYAEEPKLVSHVHLPIQSGSDRILAMMKRGHTVLEYKSKVRRLRAMRPDLDLSSDFIVGFPGETEDDHRRTLDLIDELGFDFSFSFIYSPRPGTPAATMPDDVSLEVKKRRLSELQARIDAGGRARNESMVGEPHRVIVEGRSRRNASEWAGRTANNRIVNFATPTGIQPSIGGRVDLRITEAAAHSLRGEVERVVDPELALEVTVGRASGAPIAGATAARRVAPTARSSANSGA